MHNTFKCEVLIDDQRSDIKLLDSVTICYISNNRFTYKNITKNICED